MHLQLMNRLNMYDYIWMGICHYPRFTALHNAACISMML